MFEPVHGSAPDIAGAGVANPLGAVLSAALMLDHLGETEAADTLRAGVRDTCASGVLTADLGGRARTEDVAAALLERLPG